MQITQQQAKMLELSPLMKRILEYVLTRAKDEFAVEVTLEFVQRSSNRAIFVETRAWVAVALMTAGEDMFTVHDLCRILNLQARKSVSAMLHKGRVKWRRAYWKGFAVRWDADRANVLGRVAA